MHGMLSQDKQISYLCGLIPYVTLRYWGNPPASGQADTLEASWVVFRGLKCIFYRYRSLDGEIKGKKMEIAGLLPGQLRGSLPKNYSAQLAERAQRHGAIGWMASWV